jgi:formamidopyrimidine-DNA glycosylase
MAGVENAFKSAILFRARANPFVRIADLSDGTLDRVIAQVRRQGEDARSTYFCSGCQAVAFEPRAARDKPRNPNTDATTA